MNNTWMAPNVTSTLLEYSWYFLQVMKIFWRFHTLIPHIGRHVLTEDTFIDHFQRNISESNGVCLNIVESLFQLDLSPVYGNNHMLSKLSKSKVSSFYVGRQLWIFSILCTPITRYIKILVITTFAHFF